jgi:hypothetical protein
VRQLQGLVRAVVDFHDDAVPFRPGCSYETLRKLISKGRVTGETIIRGPGTNQFWVYARSAPGVAHLMGVCHNCAHQASENSFLCEHCGAAFPSFEDRQQLGLAPVRLLPGQAHASHVAASALNADPGDSDYGPVAPTFAIAAVESAAATAEASFGTTNNEAGTQETIDALPEPEPAATTRRDRRYGRMKMAVGGLVVVVVALLIAVIAMALRSGAAGSDARATDRSEEISAVADTRKPLVVPDFTEWPERIAEAEALIATDDPAQMESGLAILRDVRANAPAGAIPAGLDERIDQLSERIESAMLRDYLGKDLGNDPGKDG